jgi:glycosyltransferase involved in cell wall biosynthesis
MQPSVEGVCHLYFGDASKHPIVRNYLRSLPDMPQEIVLGSVPDSKLMRLWRLVRDVIRLRSRSSWALQCHDVVSAVVGTYLWRGRVIYDSHEIYASLASPRMSGVVAWMERLAMRRADIIVFPSEYRAKYYEVDRNKVVIVENLFYPYATGGKGTPTAAVAADSQSGSRPLRFVYTGLFTPARAIDDVVKAFADPRLADGVLILAGRETDYLKTILDGAPENVEFRGELGHDEVCDLLATADAGFALYRPINENNRRCAPTKIFEFMYFGLHVIANNSPYVEEVIRRVGYGGVTSIDAISVTEIVDACLQVRHRTGDVDDDVREAVCWESQMPVLRQLYS